MQTRVNGFDILCQSGGHAASRPALTLQYRPTVVFISGADPWGREGGERPPEGLESPHFKFIFCYKSRYLVHW